MEQDTYLGMKMGRNISTLEIYRDPVCKFVERTEELKKLKSHLTLANRVILANTFLLPLLSYTYQFYCIPPTVERKVNAQLRSFLIPKGYFKLECLKFPTEELGLRQPLKDLKTLSIAALAKDTQDEEVNDNDLLISTQRQKARQAYKKITKVHPRGKRQDLYRHQLYAVQSSEKRKKS